MVIVRLNLIFLVIALFPMMVTANVVATVDRAVIEEGETFQLTIRSDDGEPDIDVLKRDFTVVGTSNSSKVSIINGSISSVKEMIISLAPKALGTFVIPPLQAGNQASAPIRVQVNKPSFTAAGQGADLYLEATADLKTAYVQSQIIYTVRLYRAVEIREGSLTEPELPDAVVERLGEDVTFQTRRDGRLYQVTERRFAIFPQKSGAFSIEPTVFQGQVLDNRNARPRSNDPFDRFFQNQQTKRVRVKSGGLEINVDPQPIDTEGELWLPAKRLILTESWSPEPPKFKVGEPVTRTLKIEASGLTAAQLPEIKLIDSSGIKQYADQPTVETVLQGGNLVGIREEKFAIVPTQSGKLVLPELRLNWWNTEMNRQEIITIPPKIIEVAPGKVAPVSNNVVNVTAPAVVNEPTEIPVITKEIVKTVIEAGYWPAIAVVALVAWLLTLLGWVIYWRKNRAKSPPKTLSSHRESEAGSFNAASKQLKQACKANDPVAAKAALIAWIKLAWPDSLSPSLSCLSDNLQDSTLNQALKELSQALYSSQKSTWDGMKFWEIAKLRLKIPRINAANALKSLPGLYPQQV